MVFALLSNHPNVEVFLLVAMVLQDEEYFGSAVQPSLTCIHNSQLAELELLRL